MSDKITPHQTAKIERLLSKIDVQQARLERIKTLLQQFSKTDTDSASKQQQSSERTTSKNDGWLALSVSGYIIVILALVWTLMSSYLTLVRMTGPDQEQYIPLGYASRESSNACWLQSWLHPSSWVLGRNQATRHPHVKSDQYEEMTISINATQLLVSPVCWTSLNSSVPNVIVALLEPECVCVWHSVQIVLAVSAVLILLSQCGHRLFSGIRNSSKTEYPSHYESLASEEKNRGDKYVSSTMRSITRELNSLIEVSGLRVEEEGSRESEDQVPTSHVQRRLREEFDTTYDGSSS